MSAAIPAEVHRLLGAARGSLSGESFEGLVALVALSAIQADQDAPIPPGVGSTVLKLAARLGLEREDDGRAVLARWLEGEPEVRAYLERIAGALADPASGQRGAFARMLGQSLSDRPTTTAGPSGAVIGGPLAGFVAHGKLGKKP